MTDYINLSNLNMNHFTELDAQLYCQLSNINPDDIKELYLFNNKLTDISGISIFKNIERLDLSDNQITDINHLNLKNLSKLECLYISYLNFTDELDTVNKLKTLPNLEFLICYDTFKTIDIKNELKGIIIYD